jgi:hypothetical protein
MKKTIVFEKLHIDDKIGSRTKTPGVWTAQRMHPPPPPQEIENQAKISRQRKNPNYHYPDLCVLQLMEVGGECWGESLLGRFRICKRQ